VRYVAVLEHVARKLYGVLSFICEIHGTILDIYGRFSNVVTEIVTLFPSIPKSFFEVENTCFFAVIKSEPRKISISVINIVHDKIEIKKYVEEIVCSTILFPDRVKPLDSFGEKTKKTILESARKHGLGKVVGKGIDYKYSEIFKSWFLLTNKGKKKIKSIMNSYGRIECDFVDFTFGRILEGEVTSYASVEFEKGKYGLIVFDSRELNHLVSAADWFVKQLIVIAENVG